MTVADAARYAPSAQVVAVKTCVDRYSALCLPPSRTTELIHAAASRALDPLPAPASTTGPHEVIVEFGATHPVEACTAIPTVERAGERRVRYEAATMVEALRCFKAVTTLAAASAENDFD